MYVHTISLLFSLSSPTSLVQVSKMDDESITINNNYGSEAKNYGATETLKWDEGVKKPSSTVGRIEDILNLKSLH